MNKPQLFVVFDLFGSFLTPKPFFYDKFSKFLKNEFNQSIAPSSLYKRYKDVNPLDMVKEINSTYLPELTSDIFRKKFFKDILINYKHKDLFEKSKLTNKTFSPLSKVTKSSINIAISADLPKESIADILACFLMHKSVSIIIDSNSLKAIDIIKKAAYGYDFTKSLLISNSDIYNDNASKHGIESYSLTGDLDTDPLTIFVKISRKTKMDKETSAVA